MKICVLQPSYEGSTFDYRHYDPPRNLAHLLPEHEFHHEFLKKISTFKQIQDLKTRNFDIYVNLCEGYQDSDIPSLDVILALEHFNLPYTGATASLYDPSKDLMKFVASYAAGVQVPAFVLAENGHDIEQAVRELRFPLFVKPHASGDSLGIDRSSLVADASALKESASSLIEEFGKALIEEFIDGPEFTVLICAQSDKNLPLVSCLPIEFVFPEGERFKTYDLKVRQFHPECNIPCSDPVLAGKLQDAARRIFTAFSGAGYGRMDFRISPDGGVFFLEVNFACSVFYPDGYYSSADYILQHDGLGQAGFLKMIINEGIARHKRKQKPYLVRPAKSGYGIFAARDLDRNEVVFEGEGKAQRIITRSFVERNWNKEEKDTFYRYAYPVGREVFILWDAEPGNWAPQNHSCNPNTFFEGLNVLAIRDIQIGEELTVDYAMYAPESMIPFECHCGSPECRGTITGGKGLFGE